MEGITKRSVLYITYLCNLKCKFCYYIDYKESHLNLEKIKKELLDYRNRYNIQFIDLMGGEPTIHPDIIQIIEYCRKIDLKPTIITNGQRLADFSFCESLKQSGLNDVLISILGPKKIHNTLCDSPNSFGHILQALKNLHLLGIPFRTNTVINKLNYENLSKILEIVNNRAKILNFIMFNPFHSWEGKDISGISVKHPIVAPYLKNLIHKALGMGLKINIRYFPFCQLKEMEKFICNFPQVPFDPYEWDYASWFNLGPLKTNDDYFEVCQQIHKKSYIFSDECKKCRMRLICGGFKKEYYHTFGFGEEKPYEKGKLVKDPLFFKRGT